MPSLPPPRVPWQITGNHWLSLPCIHPGDGSVHALGILHRGARSAIELAGDENFVDGRGTPLLRPSIVVNGEPLSLGSVQMAWERAHSWIPTFSCTRGSVVVRGTIFAPCGRDADVAGAVYALAVENRGEAPIAVDVAMEGMLAHRQLRVRTPRPFGDRHVATRTADDVVLLEGSEPPGYVALALATDEAGAIETTSDGAGARFRLARALHAAPGERVHCAFYVAAGPERDGAHAVASVLRRRGWRALLSASREALQALQQSAGSAQMDRLINRNLLFAYFYGVGRALDDAHYYLVRTRVPWHGDGVTVRDWNALAWTLPAVQLADTNLARELLLRMCELHGYAPGRGVSYFDGTLFEPGFTLEGAAAYAIATDRYIRDTGDDQIVDEPVLADTLYLSADDIAARRDRHIPLFSSDVGVGGETLAHPFAVHANAVVAQALDILRRTLDEQSAKNVEDPEAVRAAIRRHFVVDREGKQLFASTIDLHGAAATDDDPSASMAWLPLYEAASREDSTYRRTVKGMNLERPQLAQQCARLLGPDARAVLQWLRRAAMDGGVAAGEIDAEGKVVANGGDAALSGLVAWSVWYAVNALGAEP